MRFFKDIDQYNYKAYEDFIETFFEDNEDSYEFFHPHKFTYEDFGNELKTHPGDIYVFYMNLNKILGYGMLRGWSEGYDIPSLGIMIDKDERGQGYSYDLMKYLHMLAGSRGSKKVRLTVFKENKNAISLYKKLGYNFTDKNEHELIGIKDIIDV